MKRWLFRISIIFGVGGLVLGLAIIGYPTSEKKCLHHLENIGCGIMIYRGDHEDSYPVSLTNVGNGMMPGLQCPGVSGFDHAKSLRVDYAYVNWLPHLSGTNVVPGSYPVVYDARLSNHGGRGINILLADGSVIWDEGAKWLSAFVSSNKPWITLPGDIIR